MRAWLLLDRLLAVGGRGNAGVFLEHAAEVGQFVESDRIADIRNGQFGLLQHGKSMEHAKVCQVTIERLARPRLEYTAKGRPRQIRQGTQSIQMQILVIGGMDIINNPCHNRSVFLLLLKSCLHNVFVNFSYENGEEKK